MVDPKHSEDVNDPDDPDSIPVLIDVLVAGRPPMPRTVHEDAAAQPAAHDAASQVASEDKHKDEDRRRRAEESIEAARAAQLADFVEPAPQETPASAAPEPIASAAFEPAAPDRPAVMAEANSADLSERDAEHLAERLRVRFAGYLREEGRGVIEARCRDALQEHTSWLVRQVTREVALALEGEVVGWVRDAVREELAAHRAARRQDTP